MRQSSYAWSAFAIVAVTASCGGSSDTPPAAAGPAYVQPTTITGSVADDATDVAMWRHPSDPAKSLIIATNRAPEPGGALVVFGLDGRTRQTLEGLDRPINVDVEYGVRLDNGTADIAVVNERREQRLRVFRIAADAPHLVDIGTVTVLAGAAGQASQPTGVALYRRPSDGVVFVMVAPRRSAGTDYVWQYRLDPDGRGGVRATMVRRFGSATDSGEIEAMVVDDALGYVYLADASFGIRKWHADPDHADAKRELAVFGTTGYSGIRSGLALFARADGTGYLVATDQVAGASVLKFYRREGKPGAPHDQDDLVGQRVTSADATDGLDLLADAAGAFPNGVLAMTNSGPKNLLLFRWEDLVPSR